LSRSVTSTSPVRPAAARERRPGRLAALLTVAAALTGCGGATVDATLDAGFKKLFAPRRTPQQYMLLAVSSDDPDVRRDAVTRISRSKDARRDWAVKGYVAIALLESNAQTRCVAIRALARTGDIRAVDTCLKILNHTDYPPAEVWPPVPLVRADCAEALTTLAQRGQVPDEYRAGALRTLCRLLRNDTDRYVRLAAARGLGYFPDAEAVQALIAGLRDSEYAVVHHCEDSLVRLTGVTHHSDPAAWEVWVTEHADDLFARAGQIPETRRPPYRNGFEKTMYDTRQVLLWLWPGKKE